MNAGSKMNYADNLAHAAVSCQWGGRQGNLISVYYAGVEAKLPGRTQPCGDLTIKFNENIAITLACKMSIKANMHISHEAMEELLNALVKCDNPYNCPHGRPTIIKFTIYDLERMFKRVMN